MRTPVHVVLLLLATAPAWAAEEPSGCDKFKWPFDRERAALTAPDRTQLASGAELAALPSHGITLALTAPAEAKLPSPPERAPKEGTVAGFASIKGGPQGVPRQSLERFNASSCPTIHSVRDLVRIGRFASSRRGQDPHRIRRRLDEERA